MALESMIYDVESIWSEGVEAGPFWSKGLETEAEDFVSFAGPRAEARNFESYAGPRAEALMRAFPGVMNPRPTYNKKPMYRTKLNARDLSIYWVHSSRHWKWTHIKEKSGELIEVVEAMQVCWLKVDGKYEVRNLARGMKYEVYFVVMLNDNSWGWNKPVNLSILLPDGSKQESNEILMGKPKNRWIGVRAGEFQVSPNIVDGDIQFSMTLWDNVRRRGLVIVGALLVMKF